MIDLALCSAHVAAARGEPAIKRAVRGVCGGIVHAGIRAGRRDLRQVPIGVGRCR